jgi:hypothetical protein
MDAQTPASLAHFYDTNVDRIACGTSGFDHRSTRHARQVTCQACIALLGERPSSSAPGAAKVGRQRRVAPKAAATSRSER